MTLRKLNFYTRGHNYLDRGSALHGYRATQKTWTDSLALRGFRTQFRNLRQFWLNQ